MKKYILCSISDGSSHNAGSKAGKDAISIAVSLGYQLCKLHTAKGDHTTVGNVIAGVVNTAKLCRKLRKGDIVLLQYPTNRYLMKLIYPMLNKAGAQTVTLIHDVDFLRNVPRGDQGVEGMRKLEIGLLSQSTHLICHNESMIEALRQNGVKANMLSLGIFDYLYDGTPAMRTDDGAVIVAGNLTEKKAGYLYKLQNQKFLLSLYGSNLSENFTNQNHIYYGSFPPDALIANLKGSYGLVWDGPETDTCAGDYGQYLRFNNPHKVSLYLAAGIPLILWKQSALYHFVEEHGVGFGVESLHEIDDRMQEQDYEAMARNVLALQKKVCAGGFLKEALEKVEKSLTEE